MWFNPRNNPSALDDDWEGQPSQGPYYQWGLGIAVPTVIAAYGVTAIVAQHASFGGRGGPLTIHGTNAVALGIASISLSLFLHCHYFWGNLYDQAWFAVVGKIVSACGFIAGLCILMVRVGVLGIR